MKKKLTNLLAIAAVVFGIGGLTAYTYAQYNGPIVNIGQRHGNMRRAQENLVAAYQAISAAQEANEGQLGGHAARAKELISQADYEIRQAANVSNREGR